MHTNKQNLLRIGVIVVFNLCVLAMVWMALGGHGGAVEALSRPGSSGGEVTEIQQRLAELGYYDGEIDGQYGSGTTDAVQRFQRDNGLSADGIAGSATLQALGIGGQPSQDNGGQAPSGDVMLSGVYRQGDSGDGVAKIQQALADLGYYTGAVDGQFGSGTSHAVSAFQKNKGLSADGVVGSATLRALGLSGSAGGGISDSDYQLLARLVSAEARGEPYSGQVAVAAVILNRVEHPSFPDTVAGVAYQPGAFSSINDGQINQPVSESALRAAKEAMNGSDPSGGAIYFYNPKKTSNQWIRSRPVIKTIGDHVFCT